MALYWYEVRALRRKRSETNRTTLHHDDSEVIPALCTLPGDIPFTPQDIELRPIGKDGHILL